MASSGTKFIEYDYYYDLDSVRHSREVYFTWQVISQSEENNSSTIEWTLRTTGSLPSSAHGKTATYNVKVNGVSFSGTQTLISGDSKFYIWKRMEIPHNDDGRKTFTFTFSLNLPFAGSNVLWVGTISGSGSGVLDNIVRKPTLLTADNFTNLSNPSITYSNPMGEYATSLQVGILDSLGSRFYAHYRDVPITGSSYTFDLTDDEIDTLTNDASSGSLSVRISLKAIINGSTYVSSLTRTYTVKRAAYLTSATNFTDEENPTIKYYNQDGRSTNLRACISLTGATDDIPYRTLARNGSSYTFELTNEERETLINAVTSGSSRTVWFYLKSTFDGSTATSKLKRTFSLTDFAPYMEPVAIDMNETTFALTNDRNVFIQGYSNAACQTHAIAKKGATLVKFKFANGSQVEERDTDLAAINNVESDTFTFTATDNRGNSTTQTLTQTLIEYFKPTCEQKVTIALAEETKATATIVATGEWSSRHFGAVHNTLYLEYRYKIASADEWSDWQSTTEYITDNNEYKITFTQNDLDYTKSYTFQTRARDSLDSAETAPYTVKLIPVFDWSEDDFKFNVPVHFAKGYSVGDGESTGDYIIERGTEAMGTNGTWYWEKWASGKATCYGCRNYGAMAITTTWGNLYRSGTFTQSLPSGLFANTPEVIDITFRGGANVGGWIASHENSAPSASATGSFILVRPASATLSNSYLSFNVIGHWK